MYLIATKPDIMYAVSLVSRFMEKPYANHWEAAKRILHYDIENFDYGIFYQENVLANLVGYIDSDLAGNIDDNKSTSSYVFSLGSDAISWSS